jgi:hypothetical protein
MGASLFLFQFKGGIQDALSTSWGEHPLQISQNPMDLGMVSGRIWVILGLFFLFPLIFGSTILREVITIRIT